MNNLAQSEFPDGNPADQTRNFSEYIHMASNVGVQRIVNDATEKG